MATNGLRRRAEPTQQNENDKLDLGAGATPRPPLRSSPSNHPAGEIRHGPLIQIVRAVASVGWFISSCAMMNMTQFFGIPFYFWDKSYYYAWMSLTKQSFAVVLIMVTQTFSPTLIRVSWDKSMRGQLSKAKDGSGRLETRFPERMVLMANHQIYTDWIYLWWMAYTSRMHGAIYIILKESLKYIPIIGWGMMFYGFVFMSRKWETDKPRLQHRLQQLKKKHTVKAAGSGGIVNTDNASGLDPMWLIIFPEGTNLSANTRSKSVAWSKKSCIEDIKYQLLPRATGMFFCLQELKDTVEWVYDCTVAYEGTPKGGYAAEYFTLRSTFLQGRPPKSVNFHWRRFAVKDIPLDDHKSFEKWIEDRWREKDEFLEAYFTNGRFPADSEPKEDNYIETQVRLRSWAELLQPYVVFITVCLIANIVRRFWQQFISKS